MKILKNSFNGVEYSYIGSPLKEGKKVIFHFGSRIEERELRPVLTSALEAVKEGYEIISNGGYRARREMAKYVLSYGGTMSHVEYMGLASCHLDIDSRMEILSGGAIISFLKKDAKYSHDGLIYSNSQMLALAPLILFIGRVNPYLLRDALDLGLETAALKAFLYEKSTREYALSGGRVVDSFSSLFPYPNYIAYSGKNGDIKWLDYTSLC